MKNLITLIALLFSISAHAGASYNQYILYKSGAQPLPTTTAQAWYPPSLSYTAITIPFPLDVMKAKGMTASSASVQIVWSPNSTNSNTGASMLLCPAQTSAGSGLENCTVLAYFAGNDATGPASYTPGCSWAAGKTSMPCRLDVTSIVNNQIALGTPSLYLAIGSFGNTVTGPKIYDVELFVTWDTP